MNNFEEKLKYISKKDFDVPENYEKSVNDALNYISNMQTTSRKSNKKKTENKFIGILQKVAAIILVGTLSVTVYAGITGNLSFEKMGLKKLSQNYEENKVAINEKIENEYFTLSLENIARDSAYVILEYKINLKEKGLSEFKEITYNNNIGYTIGLANTIELNGEKNPFYITHTEKESDTEYSYYQIIYAMATGYLFAMIVVCGKSLWPCIITHSVVNALSCFVVENVMTIYVGPILLTVIPLAYAFYIKKRTYEGNKKTS